MKLWIWVRKNFSFGYKIFLLHMTVFEENAEFDIFYRDRKKCFNLLKFSPLNWQKSETTRDYMEKL